MRRIVTIVLYVVFCVMSVGCVKVVGYEGDYKGRVIDAETGQPISGVVVLGVWYSKMPTPAGSTSHFHDARETVTDEKGQFTISGSGIKILSTVGPVDIFIFKAGYEYFDAPWEALKEDVLLRKIIKWEGDKAIIPLKKLTMEERRKKGAPPRPPIPQGQMLLITEEINKDRRALGLSPF